MDSINQLHRVRASPSRRDKRLIWKSKSVQESHGPLFPNPNWGKIPHDKLTIQGQTPRSRVVEPGSATSRAATARRSENTQPQTDNIPRTCSSSGRSEGRARNSTEFSAVSVSQLLGQGWGRGRSRWRNRQDAPLPSPWRW